MRIVAAESSAPDGEAGARATQICAVVDARAVMPGRGAYLCRLAGSTVAREQCLALAERRGGIARALRRAIPGGLVLNDSKLVESVHA